MPHPAFIVFQFLIGTLQTAVEAVHGRKMRMFQFLIGTLQTYRQVKNLLLKPGFQFLIGTLQTDDEIPMPEPPPFVSIPYRYATNSAI